MGLTELKIRNDEARLFGSVDIQGRAFARHCDLDGRPLSRDKICVGLVAARTLFAKAEPRVIGVRNVLGGVVPAKLVIRSAVGRSQVEGLESSRGRLDAKGEADETPCHVRCVNARKPGDCSLDNAICEFRGGDDRDRVIVVGIVVRFDEPDSLAAAIGDKPGVNMAELKLSERVKVDQSPSGWNHMISTAGSRTMRRPDGLASNGAPGQGPPATCGAPGLIQEGGLVVENPAF
jgi:hypothetical protein